MTVDTTGGGAVVPYDPDMYGDVGLEDVGAADVVIPRLSINHLDGTFKDNLSKAEYPKLKVILLGLVKQRIMWKSEVEDGDKPLCKSPDFEHGFPNVRADATPDKRFPWDESNFNHADFPPEKGINDLTTLPCNNCVFKEWGTDKNGKSTPPPCTEQHTYPLLFSSDDGESYSPALLSLQRTGIKPSRQYISSFAQSKTPMFTVFTELSLTQQSRGTVRYAVPNLRRQEATDREMWREYADQYRTIRDFVRAAPRKRDEEGDDTAVVVPTPNVNTGPTAAATAPAAPAASSAPASTPASAPAPSAPVPTPAAPVSVTTGDDEDLPF
jgi:hypothetical protein